MERLINPDGGVIKFDDMNLMAAVIDKLRRYEDTGLTPEEVSTIKDMYAKVCEEKCKADAELKAYKDAEEQGLLIKLPCPIGTTIHRITKNPMWSYHRLEAEKRNEPKMIIYDTPFLHMYIPEFGKTVFLNPEEAEQALKKVENKDITNI